LISAYNTADAYSNRSLYGRSGDRRATEVKQIASKRR
jgi:hypothetical protein